MDQQKGKPVTTSVPSISIRFHANAEQIEELYASDDEHQTASESSAGATTNTAGIGESESSPLKYLPRLVKRSTSIDITPTSHTDASPPSDPWRFFSDIKGKITKSVEDKITEIKSRNQEEGSPLKGRAVKDSKDNSSVSDSEELSESSISKTCGIVSTTEGAEMSSDDDTPSIEKDKKTDDRANAATSSSGLRQRFRLLKPKSTPKEGTIAKANLANLYSINSDKVEQALPDDSEIESAVDALEDENLQNQEDANILKKIEEQFDNIKVDKDDVISVREVAGSDVRRVHWTTRRPKTVFAPVGFVDMRTPSTSIKSFTFLPLIVIIVLAVMYFLVHKYSNYLAGMMLGVCTSILCYYVKCLLESPSNTAMAITNSQEILEVPAVQEFQPLTKYEGWVNEFPDVYNPHTYHISQTQSVLIRLQGNLLRISHTRSKVPKRALWNEPKIKPVFTHHRVYNLLGAKVTVLPEGLAKKRHWSKKYPIGITLSKDQMHFETSPASSSIQFKMDDDEDEKPKPVKPKRTFGFGKKKKYPVMAQRFSKLTEENEEYEMDSENSRGSTPSPPSPDISEEAVVIPEEENPQQDEEVDEILNEHLNKEEDEDQEVHFVDDFDSLTDDWGTFTPEEESPTETKLYLFGRTDREKEDWFRRLKAATHRGVGTESDTSLRESVSSTLVNKALTEAEYIKYMLIFNKGKKAKDSSTESLEDVPSNDIQWINAFIGRILFDCLRDDNFTKRVKDKIQRKMASIKLPYFIEELLVTELSLGHTPPLMHRATKPFIDERGLWIDLDITYEGLIVLILQTKLNLMKLKTPHAHGKSLNETCAYPQTCHVYDRESQRCYCAECSRNTNKAAMFNSDLEDSAESTSDEEGMCLLPNQQQPALDAAGLPVQGLGGTSNTSKKFIKIVDRIAESKIFQAATEYRYIKKAMEGVSNTDLRLRVEVKQLVGTLVLNIPPPPSDRVWVGFRPTPNLALSAHPIVGERNITFLRITSWIERKLSQEFQKLMVIPNMEDFVVPVMSPKLPE